MKRKQTIRLNEAQLKRVVAESVKRVLNEKISIDDYFDNDIDYDEPTAEYDGEIYTIDDELPSEAKIMVHLRGSFYAQQFYPNRGESLRDCLDKRGVLDDLVEWWMD